MRDPTPIRSARRDLLAILALLPCFLTTILLARPAAGASFSLTTLGALANSSSFYNSRGNAVNPAGLVAATGFQPPSNFGVADARVATFNPAAPSPALSLVLPYTPGTRGSINQATPLAINSSGTIVGFNSQWYFGLPNSGERAFVIRNGTLTVLTPLQSGSSVARAVNDAGTVVGNAGGYAFKYNSVTGLGTVTNLDPLLPGTRSGAYAINTAGDIVGWTGDLSATNIPFLLHPDNSVTSLPLPAGAVSATAVDINDTGTILVSADFPSGTKTVSRPFLYSNGSYTPLPTLPNSTSTLARALNNFDQVVGQTTLSNGSKVPFLFTAGRTLDLTSLLPANSGFSPFDAADINANGLITGTALYQSNETGFLLTPPPGDANMDGTINADDYALLDRGFATHLTGRPNGDFNLDGTINTADYLLIDTALHTQAQGFSPDFLSQRESQFGPTYVSNLLASIPEPSSLTCLFALFPPPHPPPYTILNFSLENHRTQPYPMESS